MLNFNTFNVIITHTNISYKHLTDRNMIMSKPRTPKPAGFTLIELLTVIAIIGILASILIPVVSKVRETARQAVCASNIRQLSVAIILFADDNDGVMPTSSSTTQGHQDTDWIYWSRGDRELRNSPIVPYIGGTFDPSIYRCPSDERLKDPNNLPEYAYSYTMNRALDPQNPGMGAGGQSVRGQISQVRDPSRIIMLVEEDTPNDSSAWLESAADELTQRHGGLGHVSFLDGHVERVTPRYARFRGHWDPFYDGPVQYRP